MRKKIILVTISILLFAVSGIVWFWYFESNRAAFIESVDEIQKAPQEIAVKIYFGNKKMGTGCQEVFSVERKMINDFIIKRQALEELIKGPGDEETERGYYSAFPASEEVIAYREKIEKAKGAPPFAGDEVKVVSLKVLPDLTYVTFSKELEAYGGSACRAKTIRAQVRKTLEQFGDMGDIVIFVEGEKHAF